MMDIESVSKGSGPQTAMPAPKTTIGIPTYNGRSILRRTIESALRQGDDVEVVISDNASTSPLTRQICEEMAVRDQRIRYVRQPSNIGALANFRAVLSLARGTYFMWLGDDDWLDDGYVAACTAVLDRDPRHSLVGGLARYYDEESVTPVFDDVALLLEQDRPQERVLAYFACVRENGIFYGVGRTKDLLQIETDGEIASDWIHVAMLAAVGRIATLPGVHVHRTRGGVSKSVGSLTAFHGIKGFFAQPETLSALIAWRVYRVLGGRAELANLGPLGRQRLALSAAKIVFDRRYGSLERLVRKRLEIRTRAKRVMARLASSVKR